MMNERLKTLLGRGTYELPDQLRDLRTHALALSIKTDLCWHVLTKRGTMCVCCPAELLPLWLARGWQVDCFFEHGRRHRGPSYQINVYELPMFDPYADKYARWYTEGGV